MFAKILYFPLLAVVIFGGLLSLRRIGQGHLSSSSNRRMIKLAVLATVLAAGSLYLMFGVEETWAPWAAVAMVGVVVLPLLLPAAAIVFMLVWSKVTGKPIRWH